MLTLLTKSFLASVNSSKAFFRASRFCSSSHTYFACLPVHLQHRETTESVALDCKEMETHSLFARVLVENPQLFKWSLLFKAIPGLIAVLLCQAYNNCINQIYDVDIDRINKQYLPIASGDLSMKQAWFLVIFEALIGILILRLMNADRITTSTYNIRTFSVIFGPKKIVSLSVGILLINYIGAITAAIYMPQAWKLDNANYAKEASANFYLFLWKLVTLEYLLFPFM
ncbi:Homogentisate phytyltransferase 2 [Morus notabilis]|uniref:Homogentisate phytyltransferase 2 n=1 Tax=Morus notabilis TaxID=981085 RepID=W9R7Q0_9ROSA|nr:Homogentisate phytyltransferase 2 [Morus notabilis]